MRAGAGRQGLWGKGKGCSGRGVGEEAVLQWQMTLPFTGREVISMGIGCFEAAHHTHCWVEGGSLEAGQPGALLQLSAEPHMDSPGHGAPKPSLKVPLTSSPQSLVLLVFFLLQNLSIIPAPLPVLWNLFLLLFPLCFSITG